jgi:hypothetical protein
MPSRSANTPVELWPKTIGSLTDIKLSVAENGMQKYRRDLQKALDIETQILAHLNEPVEQMTAPMGVSGGPPAAPSMGGPSPFGGPPGAAQMPAPAPAGPGAGAPNPDELRRLLAA